MWILDASHAPLPHRTGRILLPGRVSPSAKKGIFSTSRRGGVVRSRRTALTTTGVRVFRGGLGMVRHVHCREVCCGREMWIDSSLLYKVGCTHSFLSYSAIFPALRQYSAMSKFESAITVPESSVNECLWCGHDPSKRQDNRQFIEHWVHILTEIEVRCRGIFIVFCGTMGASLWMLS